VTRRRRAPSVARRGATLVELLVALGIASLVIAVIVLAHRTLTRQAEQLGRHHRTAERMDTTLDELRIALQSLFIPGADPECGLTLEQSATNLVRLQFCRWTGATASTTNRSPAVTLEQVTIRYDEAVPGDLLIVRRGLTGPAAFAPDTTNRIPRAWPALRILLRDGETWKTEWTPPANDNPNVPRPNAARIQLLDTPGTPGATDAVAAETIVVIPSGLSVTSTLLRAGSTPR